VLFPFCYNEINMSKKTYDDTHELTDFQMARLRTERDFGNRELVSEIIVGFDVKELRAMNLTFVPALATYFREIVDNALDEVVGHGHGGEVRISFEPDTLTFEVVDDGRGIPSDLVVKLLARARAGRNFGQRGNVVGTNGVGAATTNFTSEFFEVDARHHGTQHIQKFREDAKNNKLVEGYPEITKCSKSEHGTKIRFRPSKYVYPNLVLPEDFVKARVYEVAAANPKLRVYYNNARIKLEATKADGMALLKGIDNVITVVCDGETEIVHTAARELGGTGETTKHDFRSTFYLVPNFTTDRDDVVHSIVNGISAYQGGTHVATFRSTFYNKLLEELPSEIRKMKPERRDVEHGMLIYNVTRMAAPNFDTQQKTKLTNPDAGKAVARAIDEKLVRKVIRDNPAWVEQIKQRVIERTQTRDLSDAAKLTKRNLKYKVLKLQDATGQDRSKCVLFIAEGDSAIKGIINVRDPKIHGGLPLRGKVMNVFGESPARVAKSEQLANLMAALGLTIGERALRAKLRYGKLYIATDEDEDGKNITALVVNFLYTYWPELFDPDLPPFVHRYETPLFILERKNERKYFFGRTAGDYDPEKFHGWGKPIRAKGLGRLDVKHMRDMIEKPSVIPFVDDGKLKQALDLIFNDSRQDDRKEWLG
jgi:DNA gyrase/topoisomerase IV subunit B